MVDPETTDRLFNLAKELGTPPIGFGVLDKRVLLPFDQLADAVASETEEAVSLTKLQEYADAGLFPLLPREGQADLGFPLYVPSRISLILKLERQHWTLAELQRVAELEEMAIDCIWTTEGLTYEDDDAKLVEWNVAEDIERDEEFLRYLETDPRPPGPPPRYDPEATPSTVRERVALARRYLESLRAGRLSVKGQENLPRRAFRIRFRDEFVRVTLLDHDRAIVRAGFSPWVRFRCQRWDANNNFTFEGIVWEWTLREPNVDDGERRLPIRLPGLMLSDGEVVLTKLATPREYDRLWREYQLDEYFHVRARLAQERLCLHCLKPLPQDAKQSRRYCSDTCRGAARQQRFRQNSPDKHMAIQERYWTDNE